MWRSFSGSSSSPTAVAPPRDSEKADECDLALAPRAGETQTRCEGTEENQEPRPNIDEPPLETGASPFRAETAKVPPATVTSAYAPTHPKLSTCSLLIFATIWGVLARLGLEWIGGFAAGRAVFALVWAQVVGSFVMGIVTERKASVERL